MILRKPYAFFIKHFKLLNVILTVLEVYVVYKLGYLVQFFFEYSSYPQGAIGQDLIGTLLQNSVFIVCAIIIAFSVLMVTILSFKKKPIKLYLFIIIANFSLIILFFIVLNMFKIIQLQVIENRTAFLLRDFLIIGMVLEAFITILTSIRAVGFDIKKFQFGQDLHELNIDDKDNEEFEVQIDFDSSKFRRKFNKNKRYFKYFVYENKFFIVLISTIIVGLTSFIIYSKAGIYFGATKINEMVKIDNFSMGIGESYLTTEDYKGKYVTGDNVLVVIPLKIKTNSIKEQINTAKFALVIGKNKFYHVTTYKDKIIDLGTTYSNQIISTDFSNYLLVYEIPKELSSKRMYLQYYTNDEKFVKFKINNINLDENIDVIVNSLGENVNFNNELIEKGILKINSFELNDKFKVDYKFCLSDVECYNSYEYIVPNYKSNYDKTILMLNGGINLEETNMNVSNLYEFINNYGTLVYTIGETSKAQRVSFTRVQPQKTKLKDIYYIEVLDEVKNAEHISIEFKLRNITYVYKLK